MLRPWLLSVLTVVSNFATAQTLKTSSTYILHAAKQSHGATLMSLTPDQALITLLGEREGEWSLKRITGWSGSAPREETLKLSGFPSDHVWGWGDYLDAGLLISPDGRYAIARLQTNAPGMLSAVRKNTEALVYVVDLKRFSLLSTIDTTDPLLAGSVWRFAANGLLITTIGAAENPKDPGYSIFERAAIFRPPSLHPETVCTYRTHFGPVLQTRQGLTRNSSNGDISESCSVLLKSANVNALDSLFPLNAVASRISKQLDFHPSGFTYMGVNTCSMVDIGLGERLALYECAGGHPTWHDSVKTTSLSYFVLSVPQARVLGIVPMEPEKTSAARLSSMDGKDYLLIMRKKVELSIYPIQGTE
jgi:hypothetical protein